MELQIDLKPESVKHQGFNTFLVDLWIDGQAFPAAISFDTAQALVKARIVSQVKGKLRNEATGELEEFEYENKVDSAGVQYTSKVYNLVPQN